MGYTKYFTKSKLKNGMVVETENGRKYLVIDNWLIGNDISINLKYFDNNLRFDYFEPTKITPFYQSDIIKIYYQLYTINQLLSNNLVLLWKRESNKKSAETQIVN